MVNHWGKGFHFYIMGSYSDDLRNPLWQRKKSEIQIRDNFKCVMCFGEKSQIHVHHLAYLPNRKPWEYENEMLVCLCDKCHEIAHNDMPKIIALISFAALKNGLNLIDIADALKILTEFRQGLR